MLFDLYILSPPKFSIFLFAISFILQQVYAYDFLSSISPKSTLMLLRSKKNHNVVLRPKTMQRIEIQESKTFGLQIKKKEERSKPIKGP